MPPDLKPGATYKFTVRSADEAVRAIREQLGENAKVLSVRQISGGGLFGKPKLEVVAQIAEPPVAASASELSDHDDALPAATAVPPSSSLRSDETAAPASVAASASERPSALNAPAATARAANPKIAAPTAARLPELLRKSGFSESLVSRLQASPAFAGNDARPLHQAFVEVGRSLRETAAKRPARPLPARSAFLGTPGVGRTTALCKWLARDVFVKGRTGRVVKAEFDRPNPAEGLAVFCEALGLSLEYHAPASDDVGAALRRDSDTAASTKIAAPTLAPEPDGGFLYADLPGLSLRNPAENTALARFLDQEKFTGRVLVLNAAYDAAMLRRAYAAGRDLGATHLVFTHLDELKHWGKLWDFLVDGALNAVLRRTLPGA